jgi:hypothetical protein
VFSSCVAGGLGLSAGYLDGSLAVRNAIKYLIMGLDGDPDGKPLDLIAAAKAAGLTPYVFRRYLDQPRVISYLRRERRTFREAICAGNESALRDIRDRGENDMARCKSIALLEEIGDGDRAASPVDAPGITISIHHHSDDPPRGPMINVTPTPAAPATPIEPSELPAGPAGFRWPR